MSRQKSYETIIKMLSEIYDRCEGEYSGIPQCCIDEYVTGKTYNSFMDGLSKSDQKKLLKWTYVPCDKCFKKGKEGKVKKNGRSDTGDMIAALIEIFQKREEQNDRRKNKRTKE